MDLDFAEFPFHALRCIRQEDKGRGCLRPGPDGANSYPFAVPGHYVAVVCLNPVTPATTDYGVAVSLRRVDGVVATPSDQEVISALAASRRVPVPDVAVQIVAFGATADNIVSEASREIVLPSSTRDEVVAAKAVDKVVPTPS